jgi:hypothetical protein
MRYIEQIKILYDIQEKLRILQENGLWEKLQTTKETIVKTILELESKIENEK